MYHIAFHVHYHLEDYAMGGLIVGGLTEAWAGSGGGKSRD